MAYQFQKNNQYTVQNCSILYDLKQWLVGSCGFVVKASGDGISNFSISGDVITNKNASGVNSINNSRAWFVIEEATAFAGLKRQWLFQTFYSGTAYFYTYISRQGYDMGVGRGSVVGSTVAVSAINAPLAYDEIFLPRQNYYVPSCAVNIMGDVSMQIPSGTFYGNFGCDTSSGKNSWYMLTCNSGGIYGLIAYDQLNDYEAGNLDPAVYYIAGYYSTSPTAFGMTSYNYQSVGSLDAGLNDPRLVVMGASVIKPYNLPVMSGGIIGGGDMSMPMSWCGGTLGGSGNTGYSVSYTKEGEYNFHLGQSSLFSLHYPSRAFPNNYNMGSQNYLMIDSKMSNVGIVWDGTTPSQ